MVKQPEKDVLTWTVVFSLLIYDDKIKNVIVDLGTFDTPEECMESIHQWWKDNNFEPGYIRTWYTNNTLVIDYGNHLGFYGIRGVCDE